MSEDSKIYGMAYIMSLIESLIWESKIRMESIWSELREQKNLLFIKEKNLFVSFWIIDLIVCINSFLNIAFKWTSSDEEKKRMLRREEIKIINSQVGKKRQQTNKESKEGK